MLNNMGATPCSAFDEFLHSLARLDLDAMMACVAEDATAFLPAEYQTVRLEGATAIRAAFAELITRWRAAGMQTNPIDPKDVCWQESGDTVIVTFHLRTAHLGRRTVVLQRREQDWQLVHLHASNTLEK
jgi:ketosteroid isomerase-like protein